MLLLRNSMELSVVQLSPHVATTAVATREAVPATAPVSTTATAVMTTTVSIVSFNVHSI